MADSDSEPQPVVSIIGAGLSGLLLAALLEKTHIPYRVFERASTVKPLGSVLSLSPPILRALDQLGLMEELKKISMPCAELTIVDANLQTIGVINPGKNDMAISGYESITFARPDLYDLMLRQVPAENITFGKKVLKVTEEDDKVTIHLSDNTAYECDILVGADGSYSAVRQSMYKVMSDLGTLPESDGDELVAGYSMTVGVTKPLDPEKYPQLKDNSCHFVSVIGGDKYSYNCIIVPGQRVCWSLSIQFGSPEESRKELFRNSEWKSDDINPMTDVFSSFPCPYGGVLGDLIEATPKELISRVYSEYKMFKTWFHGRSVLIGDACHKMLPAAGQGALNAMQDSVILANCLYDLEDNSQQSIKAVFQNYYDQRYELAKAAYDLSGMLAKVTKGQKWHERLVRTILFNLPESIQAASQAKRCMYRPQAMFLPFVPLRGTGAVLSQPPSKRYQREQEALQKKKSEIETIAV